MQLIPWFIIANTPEMLDHGMIREVCGREQINDLSHFTSTLDAKISGDFFFFFFLSNFSVYYLAVNYILTK